MTPIKGRRPGPDAPRSPWTPRGSPQLTRPGRAASVDSAMLASTATISARAPAAAVSGGGTQAPAMA